MCFSDCELCGDSFIKGLFTLGTCNAAMSVRVYTASDTKRQERYNHNPNAQCEYDPRYLKKHSIVATQFCLSHLVDILEIYVFLFFSRIIYFYIFHTLTGEVIVDFCFLCCVTLLCLCT